MFVTVMLQPFQGSKVLYLTDDFPYEFSLWKRFSGDEINLPQFFTYGPRSLPVITEDLNQTISFLYVITGFL